MAADGVIRKGDIIDDEALQAPLTLASNYKFLERQLDMTLQMAVRYSNAISSTQSTKQLSEETKGLKVASEDLIKIQNQIIKVQQQSNDEYIAQAKALKEAKQALKEKMELGDKDAKTINAQNASIKQLGAALNANRAAYAALSGEEKRNGEVGKQLLSVIEQQTAEYDDLKSSMGQHQQRVGDYTGAIKGLKDDLKAAKDEMAAMAVQFGQGSQEFITAANKAGALKNELDTMNTNLKKVSGEPLENLTGGMGLLTDRLTALDFKGVQTGLNTMATSLNGLNFRNVINGMGGMSKAFIAFGKALLTNPIFLVVAAVVSIGLAINALKDKVKFLSDAFDLMGKVLDFVVDKAMQLSDALIGTSFVADQAAKDTIEAARKQAEMVERYYDRQIKVASAAGKSTTELEKQKADAMEQAYKVAEENYNKISVLSDDEKKDREENLKNLEDASDDAIVARSREADEAKKAAEAKAKAAEEAALKERNALIELQAFRLGVIIDSNKGIFDEESNGFSNRLQAAILMYEKRSELAKLERDTILQQKDLTDSEVITAEEKYQQKLLEIKMEYLGRASKLSGGEIPEMNFAKEFKKSFDTTEGLQKNFLDRLNKSQEDFAKKEEERRKAAQKAEENAMKRKQGWAETEAVGIEAVGEMFAQRTEKFEAMIAAEEEGLKQRQEVESDRLKKQLEDETLTQQQRDELKTASEQRMAMLAEQSAARTEALEKKRAKAIRNQAIFEKGVTLAKTIAAGIQAVVSAFGAGPFVGAALAAVYGALIATQIASLKKVSIPAAEKGIRNFEGGAIIAGERGIELAESNGQWSLTGNKAALYNMPKGTNIYDHKTTLRMLAMAGLSSANNGGVQYSSKDNAELVRIRKSLEGKKEPWAQDGQRIGYVQYNTRVKQLNRWRNIQ